MKRLFATVRASRRLQIAVLVAGLAAETPQGGNQLGPKGRRRHPRPSPHVGKHLGEEAKTMKRRYLVDAAGTRKRIRFAVLAASVLTGAAVAFFPAAGAAAEGSEP